MTLTLSVTGEDQLIAELGKNLTATGLPTSPPARMRALPAPAEIIIALGSAGAFSALYQVITKLLERHKNRELKIERAGSIVTVRAHSFPEEKELIRLLAPELLKPHSAAKKASKSRSQ